MAKKKGSKAASPAKDETMLDIAVAFGNVTFGDKTASVKVSCDRSSLSLTKADKSICEHRLTGTIVAKPHGDHPDQQTFADMGNDIELEGIFDVKGISFTSDHIRFGLSFAIKSVDVKTLSSFAKRNGRLIIVGIEEIPKDENADDSEEDADDETSADESTEE